MTVNELKTKIVEEAKKRDTIILAHTYQNPDIIDIAPSRNGLCDSNNACSRGSFRPIRCQCADGRQRAYTVATSGRRQPSMSVSAHSCRRFVASGHERRNK